jgi:hypothetical protein
MTKCEHKRGELIAHRQWAKRCPPPKEAADKKGFKGEFGVDKKRIQGEIWSGTKPTDLAIAGHSLLQLTQQLRVAVCALLEQLVRAFLIVHKKVFEKRERALPNSEALVRKLFRLLLTII